MRECHMFAESDSCLYAVSSKLLSDFESSQFPLLFSFWEDGGSFMYSSFYAAMPVSFNFAGCSDVNSKTLRKNSKTSSSLKGKHNF